MLSSRTRKENTESIKKRMYEMLFQVVPCIQRAAEAVLREPVRAEQESLWLRGAQQTHPIKQDQENKDSAVKVAGQFETE